MYFPRRISTILSLKEVDHFVLFADIFLAIYKIYFYFAILAYDMADIRAISSVH